MKFLTILFVLFIFLPNYSYSQEGFDNIPWMSSWEDIQKLPGFRSIKDCSQFIPNYETKYITSPDPIYYNVTCSMKFQVMNDTKIVFIFEKILDDYYLIAGKVAIIIPTKKFALLFLKERIIKKFGVPDNVFIVEEELVNIWVHKKILVNIVTVPFEIKEETFDMIMVITSFFSDIFIDIEYGPLSHPF